MSERMSIEQTVPYKIAHAVPQNEEEREFINHYKEVFDQWRMSDGTEKEALSKKISDLDKSSIATTIWHREWQNEGREAQKKYNAKLEERLNQVQAEYAVQRAKAEEGYRNRIIENVSRIDKAINYDKEMAAQCENYCTLYEHNASEEFKRNVLKFLAGWVAATLSLIFILLMLVGFETDSVGAFVIVSVLVTGAITIYLIFSSYKRIMGECSRLKVEKEKETAKLISVNYSEVLHNIDVYSFLGIPKTITLDENFLPVDSEKTSSRPYGTYTRYIAPTGRCIHTQESCRGGIPFHVFQVAKSGLAPCSFCGNSSDQHINCPSWYTYLMKIRKISKDYNIYVSFEKH